MNETFNSCETTYFNIRQSCIFPQCSNDRAPGDFFDVKDVSTSGMVILELLNQRRCYGFPEIFCSTDISNHFSTTSLETATSQVMIAPVAGVFLFFLRRIAVL
jgi:hypothetical protein